MTAQDGTWEAQWPAKQRARGETMGAGDNGKQRSNINKAKNGEREQLAKKPQAP